MSPGTCVGDVGVCVYDKNWYFHPTTRLCLPLSHFYNTRSYLIFLLEKLREWIKDIPLDDNLLASACRVRDRRAAGKALTQRLGDILELQFCLCVCALNERVSGSGRQVWQKKWGREQ